MTNRPDYVGDRIMRRFGQAVQWIMITFFVILFFFIMGYMLSHSVTAIAIIVGAALIAFAILMSNGRNK